MEAKCYSNQKYNREPVKETAIENPSEIHVNYGDWKVYEYALVCPNSGTIRKRHGGTIESMPHNTETHQHRVEAFRHDD